MDKLSRRDLINEYKQTKLDMGVLGIKNKQTGRIYIAFGSNLPGKMNSLRFQLSTGSSMNKRLQAEWKAQGEADFEFSVLELLDYDKEGLKTDYTEELKLLLEIWLEKLPNSERLQ